MLPTENVTLKNSPRNQDRAYFPLYTTLRHMSHLSIADVPPTIISLAASDSGSELEFYSEEDLDAIP
jgi:hypothetical protein